MIIPMLCVTIFVILVVWFLLPRVARLMIHTPTAISKIGRASCRERVGIVLATDNNNKGMGDAGIKSAIQGSNVPNSDEAVPSFVSGAMAEAGKGLLAG